MRSPLPRSALQLTDRSTRVPDFPKRTFIFNAVRRIDRGSRLFCNLHGESPPAHLVDISALTNASYETCTKQLIYFVARGVGEKKIHTAFPPSADVLSSFSLFWISVLSAALSVTFRKFPGSVCVTRVFKRVSSGRGSNGF